MEDQEQTIKVEVVAGVVIKQDGKYLLLQEKQPKAYGLWNFPAGRVDVGESFEEAAVRETKEESGYDVELIKEIAIFHHNSTDVVKHAFEGKIIGGELNFSKDEILDARWFSIDEIEQIKDKLRGGWVLESIDILEGR
jgi:ADP-ribose pyrophosphatase YjhB (NUDIX family)